MLEIILIVLLVLVILSAPVFPYSRGWGYAPSGILTIILIVVLVMLIL